MPQEIALYNEFNISETLIYFGLLHKMNQKNIEARREFLVEFLDLPPKERLVKNLRYFKSKNISSYKKIVYR